MSSRAALLSPSLVGVRSSFVFGGGRRDGASAPPSAERGSLGAPASPPGPEHDERAHDPRVEIGPFGSERGLREAALVLRSMRIPHQVGYTPAGGVLVVHEVHRERAVEALRSYVEENRDWPPRRAAERPRYAGWSLVVVAFAALLAFAFVTGPSKAPSGAWFREGASVASLVLSSEPFRAVTALTLHADSEHVLANFLSGSLFGRLTERRLGPGAAIFGIVASGALGNVANAAFYLVRGEAHASIGASTAVFGAVGLLAATEVALRLRQRRDRRSGQQRSAAPPLTRRLQDVMVPVVGGLALLGTLGASPNTDIWAHAFGLLAGFVVGGVGALVVRWDAPLSWARQTGLGVAALAIVLASWGAAIVA
jgi:membrane associated rhomboid family serine protease